MGGWVFSLGEQDVEAGTRVRSGLVFNLGRKEKWGHGGHTCTISNTPFPGLKVKYTLDWAGLESRSGDQGVKHEGHSP